MLSELVSNTTKSVLQKTVDNKFVSDIYIKKKSFGDAEPVSEAPGYLIDTTGMCKLL